MEITDSYLKIINFLAVSCSFVRNKFCLQYLKIKNKNKFIDGIILIIYDVHYDALHVGD